MAHITREFTGSDADYEACVDLWNKAWPEIRRTEKIYRYNDSSRNKKYYFKRLMIEQNGIPVGFGEYMEEWESEDEDDYFLLFAFDPKADFAPLANCFFKAVLIDLKERNAQKLNTVVIEDRLQAKEYLEMNGYTFAQREPRSELDVRNFDFSRFAKLEEKLAAEGVEITNLVNLKERFPDWQRRMYDLEWPIIRDIPTPFPIKQEPFEDFIKLFNHPNYMPESDFYAIDKSNGNGEWVGLSNVKRVDGDPDYLSVGLTGILPSHRRRGIATALKLKTIKFAQQYGAKFIKTDNEENNPMYHLNIQLGFKPKPALINYELKPVSDLQKPTTSAGLLSAISLFIL